MFWLVAVVLALVVTFVVAWLLTLLVVIVHNWWPFVPSMPYSVGLQLAFVLLLSSVIGAVVKGISAAVRQMMTTVPTPDAGKLRRPGEENPDAAGRV